MANPYENILRNNISLSNGDPGQSLCKYRWDQPTIDLHKSQIRLCCRVPALTINENDLEKLKHDAILNNDYLVTRRKEMFQGIKHLDCAPCWKAEADGQPSARTGAKALMEAFHSAHNHLNSDSSSEEISLNNPILRSDSPSFLEIQLGNVCDLKCVYCWRGNSSKWAQEDLAYGKITREEFEKFNVKPSPQFDSIFWEWLDQNSKALQMISFVGGEPTLQKNFDSMLLRAHAACSNAKNESARLRIVTNLNCEETALNNLIATITNISSLGRTVLIDVSMESFGVRAEFIRYGLNWKRFEKNLNRLLELNIPTFQVAFSATINALSITSFKDFLLFLKDLQLKHGKKIPFLENSVVDPIWLAPEVLTPDFKGYLNECVEILKQDHFYSNLSWGYGWRDYANYVDRLSSTLRHSDQTQDKNMSWTRQRFMNGIKDLEKRRNLSFVDTFPEMKEFYRKISLLES